MPPAPPKRSPGYQALRIGRHSEPDRKYFLTLCSRAESLTTKDATQSIESCLHRLNADHSIALISFVVMPDHLHILLKLGDRLSLSQVVSRLKAKTKAALYTVNNASQSSFYDHSMRPDESIEGVLHYIYLNPYRANLLPEKETWEAYYCKDTEWSRFSQNLHKDTPFPEWLR